MVELSAVPFSELPPASDGYAVIYLMKSHKYKVNKILRG